MHAGYIWDDLQLFSYNEANAICMDVGNREK